MYIEKIWDFGWAVEVEKYYPSGRYVPGKKRGPKQQPTPKEMQAQNEKNRIRKVQRLIMANFGEEGYHLVLKYEKDKRPQNMQEAKKNLKRFNDRMRAAYKKYGLPYKWIAVTEKTAGGHYHHHMVVEDIHTDDIYTRKIIEKIWTDIGGCGGKKDGRHQPRTATFYDLYKEGEFEGLAQYLMKKETKEENEGCMYSCSRNLIRPVPKKRVVYATRWKHPDQLRPRKGYYIDKETIETGTNPFTGLPFLRYMMRLIRTKKRE